MATKLITLTFVLLMATSSTQSQSVEFKRYDIKSAIIKYEMKGIQTGVAEMYFDNYGMREANYEKFLLTMYGVEQESESVNYLDGFWQYHIDVLTQSATKTKNSMLESIVETSKDGDLITVGQQMFITMGGKKIGTENITGRHCEIWEMESMETKVWVWKNIPLRTETNLIDIKLIKTATSIEENVFIPADKINVPEDIDFTEINPE